MSVLLKYNIDRSLMTLFYTSYIESVITFSLKCWYGSLSVKAKTVVVKSVSSKIILVICIIVRSKASAISLLSSGMGSCGKQVDVCIGCCLVLCL